MDETNDFTRKFFANPRRKKILGDIGKSLNPELTAPGENPVTSMLEMAKQE